MGRCLGHTPGEMGTPGFIAQDLRRGRSKVVTITGHGDDRSRIAMDVCHTQLRQRLGGRPHRLLKHLEGRTRLASEGLLEQRLETLTQPRLTGDERLLHPRQSRVGEPTGCIRPVGGNERFEEGGCHVIHQAERRRDRYGSEPNHTTGRLPVAHRLSRPKEAGPTDADQRRHPTGVKSLADVHTHSGEEKTCVDSSFFLRCWRWPPQPARSKPTTEPSSTRMVPEPSSPKSAWTRKPTPSSFTTSPI